MKNHGITDLLKLETNKLIPRTLKHSWKRWNNFKIVFYICSSESVLPAYNIFKLLILIRFAKIVEKSAAF